MEVLVLNSEILVSYFGFYKLDLLGCPEVSGLLVNYLCFEIIKRCYLDVYWSILVVWVIREMSGLCRYRRADPLDRVHMSGTSESCKQVPPKIA